MRSILVAACVLALSATAASADESAMTSRFGNTTIAKNKNGTESHIYFNADHTFTGKVLRPAVALKGTWKVEGDNVCMIYTPPPFGVTNPQCKKLDAHQVGDTWTDGLWKVTIVAGIK
ncbi:MAG TPA: hypothetical protein VHU87_15320 [Rhizomicrobium sp.]|jgi:hypothetical protein|nr:hypothetical protein [Rhizomicrobium sp.]